MCTVKHIPIARRDGMPCPDHHDHLASLAAGCLIIYFVPNHEILSGTSASFADDRGLKDEVSWQHVERNHDHKTVLHGELRVADYCTSP